MPEGFPPATVVAASLDATEPNCQEPTAKLRSNLNEPDMKAISPTLLWQRRLKPAPNGPDIQAVGPHFDATVRNKGAIRLRPDDIQNIKTKLLPVNPVKIHPVVRVSRMPADQLGSGVISFRMRRALPCRQHRIISSAAIFIDQHEAIAAECRNFHLG